jgi:hypothetical protein
VRAVAGGDPMKLPVRSQSAGARTSLIGGATKFGEKNTFTPLVLAIRRKLIR